MRPGVEFKDPRSTHSCYSFHHGQVRAASCAASSSQAACWSLTSGGACREGQEPLLQHNEQTEASSSSSDVVWEGTTWQGFGGCCMCLSPLLCSTCKQLLASAALLRHHVLNPATRTGKWHITKQRIDVTHGFCSSDIGLPNCCLDAQTLLADKFSTEVVLMADTLDLRRVRDIHFHRSIWQMCLSELARHAPFCTDN